MTYAGASRARFRLADALQATFDAASANFVTFLLLALLLYALPAVIMGLVMPVAAAFDPPRLAANLFVTFATSVILQGALARGVVVHLGGGRATLGDCLRSAVDVFLPLLGISVLASLGVVVGLVFLAVPGLFLLLLWSVAAPAEVVERVGVFGAFARSARLTQGHRWSILVIFVVVWVVALVIGALVGGVLGLAGGFGVAASGGVSAQGGALVVGFALVRAVGGAVGVVFTGAAPGAIYYELRRSKEGAAPAELAAVFD